jgi:hypothetical protein
VKTSQRPKKTVQQEGAKWPSEMPTSVAFMPFLPSHKEVRSSLHRDYVRSKVIAPLWGKHFDWLFENRQKVDYRPLVTFEKEEIEEILEQSRTFLGEIERLVYGG